MLKLLRWLIILFVGFGFWAMNHRGYPELFMHYASVFDPVCSQRTGFEIRPEWVKEATEREKEFQGAWDRLSPFLLDTLVKEMKREFKRKEMTVTLSACNLVSMSDPFLINIKWFLRSFNAPEEPMPLHGFVSLVFHELLHRYLDEIGPVQPSALLDKYRDESQGVRTHLHLMAMQVHVYDKLGRLDLIEWEKGFNSRIGADYKRAWEIVTQAEGQAPFIRELLAR